MNFTILQSGVSLLYMLLGTAAFWMAIPFINATLLPNKIHFIYDAVPNALMRTMVSLPLLAFGHMFFALGMKMSPTFAIPVSLVFTTVPPVIYGLFLIQSQPNFKIIMLVLLLTICAVLLGFELEKLKLR